MKVIWKFPVSMTGDINNVPKGSRLLAVKEQQGVLTAWLVCDPDATTVRRRLHIYGTGHEVSDNIETYVGIVFIDPFVWHIFDPHQEYE